MSICAQRRNCSDESFWLSCDSKEIKVDYFKFKNEIIHFYLIQKYRLYIDVNGVCQYNGVIVITDKDVKFLKKK